jgi:tetratricopeptide (TPR) repeat protein
MSTPTLQTREEQSAFVREAVERADGLRKKKRFQEAISLLVEALQYGIDKANLYYRLGNVYFDGADLSRAEYAYNRALEVDPKHVNAMHNLAVVYKRQKKISLYVKTYKKSQRMALRYPKNVKFSAGDKRRIRFLSMRVSLWIVGGFGLVVLLIWLFGR